MKALFLVSICLINSSCKYRNNHKAEKIPPASNSVFVLTKQLENQFLYCFHILDSASGRTPGDTIECCHNETWFLEEYTKIESEGAKGYIGNESFTKNDLRKWHSWYDSTLRIKK